MRLGVYMSAGLFVGGLVSLGLVFTFERGHVVVVIVIIVVGSGAGASA